MKQNLEEEIQCEKLSAKRQFKFWAASTLIFLSGTIITGYFLDNDTAAVFSGSMTAYSSVFALGKYLTCCSHKQNEKSLK